MAADAILFLQKNDFGHDSSGLPFTRQKNH